MTFWSASKQIEALLQIVFFVVLVVTFTHLGEAQTTMNNDASGADPNNNPVANKQPNNHFMAQTAIHE